MAAPAKNDHRPLAEQVHDALAHDLHEEVGHHPPVLHRVEPKLPLGLRARSFFSRVMIGLYLPAIFQGLAKTLQWMWRPKFTEEYPHGPGMFRKSRELHKPRVGYRGEHRLKKDDQGRPNCVACFMCATACPAECITIEAGVAPWPDRDKVPVRFEIDMLKCIYCGMCQEACPCDAIELTQTYTQVATSRAEKIYDMERLLRN
jgi:NADH-quinone oxidoreductase subunit I